MKKILLSKIINEQILVLRCIAKFNKEKFCNL